MVDKERIKLVIEILEKEGRLTKNELIRRLKKEGSMARQTASNAIDEAVDIHRIYRQDDVRGQKQHIVFLDISPDISKIEKHYFQELELLLKKFDEKFSIFRDKYSSLSIENRGDGIDTYRYLYRNINMLIEWVYHSFNETKQWKDMFDNSISKWKEFNKLAKTETKDDAVKIGAFLIGQHFLDVKDAFEDVDEYLNYIK